jgi:hypothetical protein
MDNMIDGIKTIASVITSLGVIFGIIWKPCKKGLEKMLIDANEPLRKELNSLIIKVDNMDRQQLTDEKDTLRRYILTFSGEIRVKKDKTRKQYEEFFRIVDKYEDIIIKLNEVNGYVDSEVDYVRTSMNRNI